MVALWWFGAGLLVLVGASVAVGRLTGIILSRAPLTSMVRVVAQLSVVALLLRGIADPAGRPRQRDAAVAGIAIGSAMSAATLAERNLSRGNRHRRDEIGAWLSLGATPARAHLEAGQETVRESLLPNLDQTRSTGLVTLPGAFVGALFGGPSPVEAAQSQLVVLAAIPLATTCAA